MVINGTYDYRLVAFSVLLAMLASYAALDLAGRVTAAQRWARAIWLSGGAVAMGLGIWSMHYIGMLAFRLPVDILYHYPTVILSLLAAIAASAVALFIVSRPRMGVEQEILGSVVMGIGIASMHYIGMAAMRLPAEMEYRRDRVAISVAAAIAVSLVALILSFRTREEGTSARKILSAFVMGAAIPLMHYTGMWAVSFRSSGLGFSTAHAVRISVLGVLVISAGSLLVLFLTIGTAFLDRLLETQKRALLVAREGEANFRALGEAIPEIVWTAEPNGTVDYSNQRWRELTGLSKDQALGEKWIQAIHPDDLEICRTNWEEALRTGESYEAQYRLRDAKGQYRWHLVRATAVRTPAGAVAKWFGTCTDIENQKHTLEVLEEQVRDRTVELADANTRLQEEMWERDMARKALDQQNERMVHDLTERSQRATLLAKMGELLQSCVTKEEVFAAALGFAPKIFPLTRGAIALFNSGRSLLEVIGSWSDCDLSAPVFESTSCWALRTGHPHLVVAGDSTARCAHAEKLKHTYLCIPIQAQGEAMGIIHFQTTDEVPTLADSELSFKTTFAAQLGLSISNIGLREALRTQSIRDPLTGLYNRRYLQEMLEREIRRAVRADQALGLLMLDLDHFKKFNDTYGHEAGDTVLREAATFLMKNIRAEDIVCRYGGEEFVVILPTATLDAAKSRAERIRSRLREVAVLHRGQPLGVVTVSIGVAAVPEHGTSPKEVLEAADAAMYQAKRDGRDRVSVAVAPDPEATLPQPEPIRVSIPAQAM
jgi:diguanylate cyclase (GGDEF)-like protein/PAS domain S-box-containing protein